MAHPEKLLGPFFLTRAELDILRHSSTLEEVMEKTAQNAQAIDEEVIQLDVTDALRLAEMDVKFSSMLLKMPEEFQEPFSLSSEQVAALRSAPDLDAVRTQMSQSSPK